MTEFKPGDRVIVVKVRPYLYHELGDTGTVLSFNPMGSPETAEIKIMWDSPKHEGCVLANQFELAEGPR